MTPMNASMKGYVLAFLATFAFGFTFISIKYSLSHMDILPFTIVWFGASILYSIAMALIQRDIKSLALPRKYAVRVLAAGACSAAAVIPSYIAVKLLDPTLASLLSQMQIVIILFMGVLFLGERFNLLEGSGLAIACLGILVTNWHPQPVILAGFLWMLLASIGGAGQVIITSTCVKAVGTNTMLFYRSVFVTVAMLICMAAQGQISSLGNLHIGGTLSAMGGSFIGAFLGMLLYFKSLKYIDVAKSTAITQASPVFVAILGLIFLQVIPSAKTIIGGAIMLIGLVIMIFGSKQVYDRELESRSVCS